MLDRNVELPLPRLLVEAPVANTTVISDNSAAYALGVDINVADELLTVDVTAPSNVSGSSPAPYNINNSVLGEVDLGAGVTVGNLLDVQAAAFDSPAKYTAASINMSRSSVTCFNFTLSLRSLAA